MINFERRIRRRPFGFTLIELLVVVAIIAVLVAVLLPALHKARESARTAVCLTNIKSQAGAVMMYEMDWNIYPPIFWGNPGVSSDWTIWAQFIGNYVGGEKFLTMQIDSWRGVQKAAAMKVFCCPAARHTAIGISEIDDPSKLGLQYAYSDLIHQIRNDTGPRDSSLWLRSGRFSQSPDKLRMLCDAESYFTHFCPGPTVPPCAMGWLGWDIPGFSQHGTGMNIGFWDGHADFRGNIQVLDDLTLHGHFGM